MKAARRAERHRIEGSTLECATIEVPRDWSNAATSDKLALQLIRQPSKNPNAKSIITNPGGPGESGIEMIITSNTGLQQTFGDFHIISFDPRGVGLTMPYKDCKASTESSKWKDTVADTDDQATYDYKAAKAWSDACAAENKDWGTLIGTAYVARDIMAIVEALEAAGEDGRIRYAGYSYGTLLGATLTAMFPDKVARVLLDGNINPTDYYRGDGTEAGADVTKGIENFFAQCAEAGKENCALADKGQSAQQLLAEFDELLEKLSKTSTNKNFIVRNEFFKVLYFRKPSAFKDFAVDLKTWITNPDSVNERAAKRDDFQASKWQKLQQNQAIMGITCGDRIVKDGSSAKYTQLKEAAQQKLKYSYDITMAGQFECTVWEQNAAERFMGSFSDIETSHPILIVNTPWDPVTPAISAEASRKAFRDSKLVMSNGVGHCSSAHGNPDLDLAIKKYFEEGKLPDLAEYKIADNNVFRKVPEPPTVAVDEANVPLNKRSFRYPDYFQKRADDVPAGCTKIPASSSALVSLSSSVAPSASVSASVSLSVSVSVSQSQSYEPTPSASPLASTSASESLGFLQSESASASVLAVPTAFISQLQEPMPSASASDLASPSASVSAVPSHSESASASILATPSVSASESLEATPFASASASESPVLSHSGFWSASVTPSAPQSESHAMSPTLSASVHSGSTSVSVAYVSSSVPYSETSLSASPWIAGEQGSQSASVAISSSASAGIYSSSALSSASASASASVSVDYTATAFSVLQSSSNPAESLTPSSSASVTSGASYSAASSANHVSSSSLYLHSDVQASQSASFYSPSVSPSLAHVDISSSPYPACSLSAYVSASASLSYSTPAPSSSVVYSDSTNVHPSASSSVVYPDASVHPSRFSSVSDSQNSQYPSVSSSVVDNVQSPVTGPSSTGSYYTGSTSASSFGSSTALTSSKTKSIHNHYPTTKPHMSSTFSQSFESKYPYPSSVPTYSSSITPYPKGDDYAAGGDYASGKAYPTGFYPVTTSGKPSGPKVTSAPCITVPWSSQPGYVPITKTYTTTSVRTVTKCLDTVKDCPLNSSTKIYITTEIKTRTTVVATPSSAPTSGKSYPPNKQGDKSSASPPKETGKVPNPPKDSSYPFQPVKNTSYHSRGPKSTSNSSQAPKETRPVQSTHSAYAPPKISSHPSVSTTVPPYPTGPSIPSSIKVCNDMECSYVAVPTGTKPFVGTGASTTLKTSTPSASVCVGKNCKTITTPTGYKPAEFTGAASREFVSSMVGTGAMIIAFARFF
ncbi:hypothetical protein E8E12_001316 [Didymella heteroderae]|uniref:Peptidase S33 tripeptidyl aminopeptidase-like C-terminal domain-containing protein n=1 Tax=Didymella heteroderae TaxID=1769908 RepID=A0A9P5BVD6_9PLEO|nr:hypothetical protein E8E12_001316 [Didymella heteroderae]